MDVPPPDKPASAEESRPRKRFCPGVTFDVTGDRAQRYSDLIIRCGRIEFPVHRYVVCSQSEFFERACKPHFKEEKEVVVVVQEDAFLVEKVIDWFYTRRLVVTDEEQALRGVDRTKIVTFLEITLLAQQWLIDELELRAINNICQELQLIDLESNSFLSAVNAMDRCSKSSIFPLARLKELVTTTRWIFTSPQSQESWMASFLSHLVAHHQSLTTLPEFIELLQDTPGLAINLLRMLASTLPRFKADYKNKDHQKNLISVALGIYSLETIDGNATSTTLISSVLLPRHVRRETSATTRLKSRRKKAGLVVPQFQLEKRGQLEGMTRAVEPWWSSIDVEQKQAVSERQDISGIKGS